MSLVTELEVLLGDTDVQGVASGLRTLLEQHRFTSGRVGVVADELAGWIRLRRSSGEELTLRVAEIEREGDTLRRWELRSVAGSQAGRLELVAIYLTDWLHAGAGAR